MCQTFFSPAFNETGLWDQAVERRVSLVVGPPGTGKTFIAMKILELHRSARVLVLTHKNRCLDDFLYQ